MKRNEPKKNHEENMLQPALCVLRCLAAHCYAIASKPRTMALWCSHKFTPLPARIFFGPALSSI